MDNNLSTQLGIFDDKIAIDKNFSPDTRITDSGEVEWKYDLKENFDKLISSKFYRNPNLKLYYQKISNIYNNLRNKKNDQLSFDEIAHILNLSGEARFIKPKITKNTNLLLKLPTLKGLNFKWLKNPNGYAYKPTFHIKSFTTSNPLIENEEQKFRRLDIYLITLLKEWSIDFTQPNKEIIGHLFYALKNSYKVIFKREPTTDEQDEFFTHFTYKGRYTSYLQEYQKLSEKKLN